MFDKSLYGKVRDRINRRLILSPRLVIGHAIAFTGVSVVLGFTGILTSSNGIMDGVIYWTIWLWSLVLLAHVTYTYANSAAWERRRERLIEEEVLDMGDQAQLSEDEMVSMHMALTTTLEEEGKPFLRLMLNALINAMLWPGMLVFGLVVQSLLVQSQRDGVFSTFFSYSVVVSLLGTLLAGTIIPVKLVRSEKRKRDARLHNVYARSKRKRQMTEAAESELRLGDDGELIPKPEFSTGETVRSAQVTKGISELL